MSLPTARASGSWSPVHCLVLMLTAYYGNRTIPMQAGQTDASATPTTEVAAR